MQQLEDIHHEGGGDHRHRKIEDRDRSHNRDYHTGAKYRPPLGPAKCPGFLRVHVPTVGDLEELTAKQIAIQAIEDYET